MYNDVIILQLNIVIIDGDKGRYEVFDVYSESNNLTV